MDHLGYANGTVHGVTTYLVSVVPRLVQAGHRAMLCVLSAPHGAAKRLQDVGMEPIFFHRKKWDLRALLDLRRFLRAHNVDLIHVAQQKAMALARVVASAARTPVLLHLHDPDRPGMLRAVHSLYARPTDRLVGVSQEACGRAAAFHVPSPRVQVLHNALEVDDYARRASVARQRVRAELSLAPDAPVVGTLSRLFPTKGHRALLRVFPQVLERFPTLTLLIPGSGPEREPCEQLAQALGIAHAVRFLGQRSDIPEFLSALDFVVIASREEGFPFAGVEAMACGVPIVAFAVGGLPELVQHRRTGMLIPPGDAPGLAAAMIELLSDATLRESTRAASVTAAKDFDIDRHVARLQEIYGEMLSQSGSPS